MTSTVRVCALLGKPQASHYRDKQPPPVVPAQRPSRGAGRPRSMRAFYLLSVRTMHRLLRLTGVTGTRRAQMTRPAKTKPE